MKADIITLKKRFHFCFKIWYQNASDKAVAIEQASLIKTGDEKEKEINRGRVSIMSHECMELQHVCEYDSDHAFFFCRDGSYTIQRVLQMSVPRVLVTVKESRIVVMHLFVPEESRQRGYGKALLYFVAKLCLSLTRCCRTAIFLHDASERYRRSGNIYRKVGFQYTGEGTEMVAFPDDVIKTLSTQHPPGLCGVCGMSIGSTIHFAYDERFCGNHCRARYMFKHRMTFR